MGKKVSIIIATFNSSKTLPLVLNALEKQSFPKTQCEVLIVDGGSTDTTREIAKKYKCRVINNPRTEPVYAKFLGFREARGKYIVYLDHDEVLKNPKSLEKKYVIFQQNEKVRAVITTGYENPDGYPFINEYINEFGEPFSFFIYRLSKDARFFLKDMKKQYPVEKEMKDYTLFTIKKLLPLPIIELCAAASMIDAEYIKKTFPNTLQRPDLIPHFFYLLREKDIFIALTKNDPLIHYSSEELRKYLMKINWRIKNNIYFQNAIGQAGFSGRLFYARRFEKYKKFLFLPYNFLLLPVILDACYLVWSRRNVAYFLHVPLSIYTASSIVYHYTMKTLGYQQKLKSYDEKKIITVNE